MVPATGRIWTSVNPDRVTATATCSGSRAPPPHGVLRNRENAARKSLPGTLIAGKVNQPPGRSARHRRQALHKRILGQEHLRQVNEVEPLHIGQVLDPPITDPNAIGIAAAAMWARASERGASAGSRPTTPGLCRLLDPPRRGERRE